MPMLSCTHNLLVLTPESTCRCYVCSTATMNVYVDTTKMTLRQFIDRVLRGAMGINVPYLETGGNIIYEEDEVRQATSVHGGTM